VSKKLGQPNGLARQVKVRLRLGGRISMAASNASRSPLSSSVLSAGDSMACQASDTLTTPSSITAAAKRCSKASARGAQYPPWLTA
jgi:hypothetical protein